VVMQFARVAHHTDFIYCYTILESNKRSEYGPSPNSNPNANATVTNKPPSVLLRHEPVDAELNTFFPFDPYRLPRSNVFIQGVYREWAAVAIDDDDDDDDEDDDENEDEDECKDKDDLGGSGYLNIPQPSRSQDGDDGGLGASLGGMSISPKVR
jgi:RNA polymerase I-specific transcription initiation factor RRN3